MDFTKFVSMLENSALYFCRSDLLGDPFEGSFSKANDMMRPLVYKDIPEEKRSKFFGQQADFNKWQRQWTFISCWHMNHYESAAMWKLYAKTNEAVAVRSSFSRLCELVDESTHVGCVEYIDFESQWLPEGNAFYPFVHKRLSFAHENEIRAVIQKFPIVNSRIDSSAIPPLGITRSIDISKLFSKIYIAPTSPGWFKVLVENICCKYNLKMPIVQSSLDAEPIF